MEKLRIHSDSEKDYLRVLQQKYDSLKQSLRHNPKLTNEQKDKGLKSLNAQLKTERKNSPKNLY